MTTAHALTLYGETGWVSPWVFHAMAALEEKQLAYHLELVPLPIPAEAKALLVARTVFGKVPALQHGDVWIGDSLAISEYLAETFPVTQGHPRLFPADLGERARARAVMAMVRTSFGGLRDERPTTSAFGPPVGPAVGGPPLGARAAADAAELLRVAAAVIGERETMFGAWCIADADLALMLMRLVHNGDPVPPAIERYARANWARPSVAAYVARARAAHFGH